MKIIEYKLVGKRKNQNECEDGIFISDKYIAVVDGATSQKPFPWAEERGGRIAMTTILKALKDADGEFSANEMISYLETALSNAYGEHRIEAAENVELQMYANIIIYSVCKREIWRFGDCNCMINNLLVSYEKKIDELIAEKRSEYLINEIANGKSISQLISNDSSREHIEPYLAAALKLANSKDELGYIVLNGINADPGTVDVFYVNEDDEVIFASDGYPVLKNTLFESEKSLNEIINLDPLMYSIHKSVKGMKEGELSFDDRAYIRFVV